MKLSLFGRRINRITTGEPTIIRLMPGAGIQLSVPAEVWSNDHLIQPLLRANVVLSPSQVKRMYRMLPETTLKRAKFCKHGHRQVSENVIHWPNGNEYCRVCYMGWKQKGGAK